MKTHLFLLCYFVVFCHAQNPAIQSPATDTNYVSMKINGVEWKSSVGAGVVLADGFQPRKSWKLRVEKRF